MTAAEHYRTEAVRRGIALTREPAAKRVRLQRRPCTGCGRTIMSTTTSARPRCMDCRPTRRKPGDPVKCRTRCSGCGREMVSYTHVAQPRCRACRADST